MKKFIAKNPVKVDILTYLKHRAPHKNPWLDTVWAPYVGLDPKIKGGYLEVFARKVIKKLYAITTLDSGKTDYDCLDPNKNDGRVELKGSVENFSCKTGKFVGYMFNHISIAKQWDRIILTAVKYPGNEIMQCWFTKSAFTKEIRNKFNNKIFSYQQAGKKSGNDDFMVKDFEKLLDCSWVFSMKEWDV